jgi:tRNA pseudouridine(38-40) synthase
MLKVPVHVHGSGRTDTGVHAIGQVAHFDIVNQSVPVEVFPVALNQLLPHDIRITASALVNERFHARFTSISREYRYYVKRVADYTPFDRDRVCRVRDFPPLGLLNAYASRIIGTHDFSTFSAAGDQSHSRVRAIYVSEFTLTESQWGGEMLVYRVSGNAFLCTRCVPWSHHVAVGGTAGGPRRGSSAGLNRPTAGGGTNAVPADCISIGSNMTPSDIDMKTRGRRGHAGTGLVALRGVESYIDRRLCSPNLPISPRSPRAWSLSRFRRLNAMLDRASMPLLAKMIGVICRLCPLAPRAYKAVPGEGPAKCAPHGHWGGTRG